MTGGRQRRGRLGEGTAVGFLQSKGYRIVGRNVQTPYGEIDIVAKEGDELVFVEVKASMGEDTTWPEERVSKGKQRRLGKAAQYYLIQNNIEDVDCRFDVIAIRWGKEIEVVHIDDAFWLD